MLLYDCVQLRTDWLKQELHAFAVLWVCGFMPVLVEHNFVTDECNRLYIYKIVRTGLWVYFCFILFGVFLSLLWL